MSEKIISLKSLAKIVGISENKLEPILKKMKYEIYADEELYSGFLVDITRNYFIIDDKEYDVLFYLDCETGTKLMYDINNDMILNSEITEKIIKTEYN